jgi:hypothetical protein
MLEAVSEGDPGLPKPVPGYLAGRGSIQFGYDRLMTRPASASLGQAVKLDDRTGG